MAGRLTDWLAGYIAGWLTVWVAVKYYPISMSFSRNRQGTFFLGDTWTPWRHTVNTQIMNRFQKRYEVAMANGCRGLQEYQARALHQVTAVMRR